MSQQQGLDPITTKTVNDLIFSTANDQSENELTSIIISHDVKASLEISDYVAFLESGEVIEYLPVEEFKKSSNPVIKNLSSFPKWKLFRKSQII